MAMSFWVLGKLLRLISADPKKLLDVCDFQSTLNLLVTTGEVKRATKTSGQFGMSGSKKVGLGGMSNIHPALACPLMRHEVGQHVVACLERFDIVTQRPIQPHDPLPARLRLPDSLQRHRWIHIPTMLKERLGLGYILRGASTLEPLEPEDVPCPFVPRNPVPGAELGPDLDSHYKAVLKDQTSQIMCFYQGEAYLCVANRRLRSQIPVKYQVKSFVNKVAKHFTGSNSELKWNEEAQNMFDAVCMAENVTANHTRTILEDPQGAAQHGIAPLKIGVLAPALLIFDLGMKADDAEATVTEVQVSHVMRAYALYRLIQGIHEKTAESVKSIKPHDALGLLRNLPTASVPPLCRRAVIAPSEVPAFTDVRNNEAALSILTTDIGTSIAHVALQDHEALPLDACEEVGEDLVAAGILEVPQLGTPVSASNDIPIADPSVLQGTAQPQEQQPKRKRRRLRTLLDDGDEDLMTPAEQRPQEAQQTAIARGVVADQDASAPVEQRPQHEQQMTIARAVAANHDTRAPAEQRPDQEQQIAIVRAPGAVHDSDDDSQAQDGVDWSKDPYVNDVFKRMCEGLPMHFTKASMGASNYFQKNACYGTRAMKPARFDHALDVGLSYGLWRKMLVPTFTQPLFCRVSLAMISDFREVVKPMLLAQNVDINKSKHAAVDSRVSHHTVKSMLASMPGSQAVLVDEESDADMTPHQAFLRKACPRQATPLTGSASSGVPAGHALAKQSSSTAQVSTSGDIPCSPFLQAVSQASAFFPLNVSPPLHIDFSSIFGFA